jgi:Domain of unknown function (DUF4129)
VRRTNLETRDRRSALFFLLASLLLTAFIATGLSGLRFGPGMPLPIFERGEVAVPVQPDEAVGMPVNAFAVVLLLILLGVVVLVAIVLALRGVPWKQLLRRAWSLAWKIGLAAVVIAVAVAAFLQNSRGTAAAEPLPPPRPLATAPLGSVPAVLLWLVGIGLGGGAVALGVALAMARRRPPASAWELELESARDALRDGADLRQVIIDCYRRMGRALRDGQNLLREAFMTTGEFEELLAAKGVPREPVHQLTLLFEAARYGIGQPDTDEEVRALACLEDILEYSRGARRVR